MGVKCWHPTPYDANPSDSTAIARYCGLKHVSQPSVLHIQGRQIAKQLSYQWPMYMDSSSMLCRFEYVMCMILLVLIWNTNRNLKPIY